MVGREVFSFSFLLGSFDWLIFNKTYPAYCPSCIQVFRHVYHIIHVHKHNLECRKHKFSNNLSPVYTAQTNPGRTRVKTNPGCVYIDTFPNLPGLVVFTQQTDLGRTRVSSVYMTETNPG